MNQKSSSNWKESLSNWNNNWNLLPEGFRALLVSVLFLVLGFLTLWLAKVMLKTQQDAVLVAILLIPILAYLILSGKLLEFNAGGVSAKFNAAAQKPFFNKDEMSAKPVNVESTEALMKGGREELERYLRNLSSSRDTKYFVLAVMLRPDRIRYRDEALLIYLKVLSRYQNFRFLVVLNQKEEVFAYISAWRAIQILEAEQHLTENFARAISEGQEDKLLNYYGLVEMVALTTETNLEALEKMTANRMDALIVADENHKLKGIVEREQLLSKLILAATK